MRNYTYFGILCFAVLLSLQLINMSALAQPPKVGADVIVLKQTQLPVGRKEDPLSSRIIVESIEGNTIALDRVPSAPKTKVEQMASRIMPRIEFNSINAKEIIRFVVKKPKPKHMIHLGLVSDHQERLPDPAWLDDLQLGNRKLSCTFTNASLLDLSLLLADVLDCEFGVAASGEILFRNTTKHARTKHPVYILKRKKQKSNE